MTAVWEIRDGLVAEWQLDPADVGLAVDDISELAGGEPRDNASRIQRLLEGKGSAATRAAVLLNAAAGLYVSGLGLTYAEAADLATRALADGSGAAVLERVVRLTRQ